MQSSFAIDMDSLQSWFLLQVIFFSSGSPWPRFIVKVYVPVAKFRGPMLHCLSIDIPLPESGLEPRQDIFIWHIQDQEEMNHRSHLDCH
jgi:hypothetical protein